MTNCDQNRDINLIISKIKSYIGVKTDTELASFLGTSQSNIGTWKKRNTINYELIIKKCPNIDANWLITGKDEMLKKSYTKNDTNIRLNKSQILNEIMEYLGLDNDVQLSKSLKVSEERIALWRRKNILDYDLIYLRYPFFSIEWLTTGMGEKLRTDQYATKHDLQEIYSIVEKMQLKQEAFYELMMTVHDNDDDNSGEIDAVNKFKSTLDSIN